jgi:hypothetical protein
MYYRQTIYNYLRSMKKLLFIPLCLATVLVGAQTLSRKVVLTKGQQLERVAAMKMNFGMEMMGQTIDMKMDNTTTSLVEVKNASAQSFDISSTVKRVVMTMNSMGQDMNYDSDKKDESPNEMTKKLGEMVGKTANLTIDNKGFITASDDTAKAEAAGGGFMGMAGNLANTANKIGASYDMVANFPVKGVKAGDTWADSTVSAQGKMATTYTVLDVKGAEATIGMDGTVTQSGETENNGMTINLSIGGKSKGQYTMDVATGVIKKRTVVLDATGTMEMAGQSVPFTMKMNMDEDINKK